MTLPNFLIIGAQKAGSTWLASQVRQHPDIFLPAGEVHYFNLKQNYRKGAGWYQKHFAAAESEELIGEKTPNYLWVTSSEMPSDFGTHLPFIHRNIYCQLPESKLIVTLRNPVERAISAVNHYYREGQISPLLNIDGILVGDQQHWANKFGVIEMGLYHRQIQAYLEIFETDQMLLLIFEEDIVDKPMIGLQKVFDFLQIEANFQPQSVNQKINQYQQTRLISTLLRHYLPSIYPRVKSLKSYIPRALFDYLSGPKTTRARPTKTTIRKLYQLYELENNRLFQFLGREVPSWRIEAAYTPGAKPGSSGEIL